MYLWILLAAAALILLGVYFKGKNAVWGGLTIGIIVGVLWKIFGGTEWLIIVKTATIGTYLGFGAELLGLMGNYFKKKSKQDLVSQLVDPKNEVVAAFNWLKDKEKLQNEFNEIYNRYGEFEGPVKAQEWLLEKYRKEKR